MRILESQYNFEKAIVQSNYENILPCVQLLMHRSRSALIFLLFYSKENCCYTIEINWNNTSSFQFTIHMPAYVWDWGHRVTCTAKSILYVFPFLTAKMHPLYISMWYQLPVCRGHQSFPGTSARILSRRHLRHIDYLNVLLHDWNGSTFWNCWNFCHPRHCEKFPKSNVLVQMNYPLASRHCNFSYLDLSGKSTIFSTVLQKDFIIFFQSIKLLKAGE